MTNRLPAYVIKAVSIAAGAAGNRIGQASQITIPTLGKTMEEFRNAGMIKPRMVVMGYEATSCTFEETAFDPDMIALFGLGAASSLIAYGAMESEDGTSHSARFEMVGEISEIDPGAWSNAGRSTTTYNCTVHSGVLYIDDEEVYAFDDFSVRIRGREQMPGRRRALRLD
jgi:hypothetical protein